MWCHGQGEGVEVAEVKVSPMDPDYLPDNVISELYNAYNIV